MTDEKDENPVKRRSILQESAEGIDPSNQSRRGVLKGVLAGTASTVGGAFGLSGSVAGSDENIVRREAKEEYNSSQAVLEAVETHGTSLLSSLEEKGLLESSDPSELPIDTVLEGEEYVDAKEGTSVAGMLTNDRNPTAHIMIKKDREKKLAIIIRPQQGRCYATYDGELIKEGI